MADAVWSRYLPRSTLLRDSGLSCRGFGRQGTRPAMTARRLPTYALLFVTAGRGRYAGAPYTAPVEISAPAVVWLFPGVEHVYDPAGATWQEHWVLFEGTAVRAYESLRAWRRDQPVRPAGPELEEAIAPLFAALRAGTATPGRRAELLAATVTHALIGVAAEQTEPDPAVRPGGGSEPAAERVMAGAFGSATVGERARESNRSADQLRREVAEETSLSVHELVIQTRVARAQELLATTDLPVSSIARQVGYDDPAYFSRLFAARVGVAPTAFRRQVPR